MLATVTRWLLRYKWIIAAGLVALALISVYRYVSNPVRAGEYILLTSDEYHWPEDHIFAVLPDGSQLTRLGKGFDPACSPDGRRIAFAAPVGSFLPDGRNPYTQIFVMGADGSNVKQVTFGDDYSDSPTWSPDGRRLAFPEYGGIAIMDVDSLEVTHLTNLGRQAGCPTWSPDEQRLVLCVLGKQDNEDGLYVVNADGSNLTRLTNGNDWEPDWSPDGRHIVFLHSETPFSSQTLRVVEADGGNPMDILPGEQEGWSLRGSPKWSPDSQRIIVVASHLLSPEEAGISTGAWRDAVYMVNADGSGLRLVIQPNGRIPGWEQGALLPLLRSVGYGKVDWCKVR
jgi:Tol biopolymer transport system component